MNITESSLYLIKESKVNSNFDCLSHALSFVHL